MTVALASSCLLLPLFGARLIVKEIGFVDLIVSRGRLFVKEVGFVGFIVSRDRLIVKELDFVDLYRFLFLACPSIHFSASNRLNCRFISSETTISLYTPLRRPACNNLTSIFAPFLSFVDR